MTCTILNVSLRKLGKCESCKGLDYSTHEGVLGLSSWLELGFSLHFCLPQPLLTPSNLAAQTARLCNFREATDQWRHRDTWQATDEWLQSPGLQRETARARRPSRANNLPRSLPVLEHHHSSWNLHAKSRPYATCKYAKLNCTNLDVGCLRCSTYPLDDQII